MAAEIDCVAVTDHNSGEWIDKLKEVYQQMKRLADVGSAPAGFRELYLFPGVEISVNGGLHVLAIFDLECSTSTISSLLGGVGFPAALHGETNSSTEAACSRDSLVQVVEEIHRCDGIAIPAHTDKERGLLETTGTTNRGAKHKDAIRSVLASGLLAVEVVHLGAQKPAICEEERIRWAEVLGSDCHSFGNAAIPGTRFTWIKMATPSLEGLRLALLDGQGVSVRRSDDPDTFSPFDKPANFIESIEISEARLMGGRSEPARFAFNPYFNALVGGRGTGKSTVVHSLRLAYHKESELKSAGEAEETFTQFNKVARTRSEGGGLLADTQITLTLNREGVRHRVLRRQNGQGTVVEDWDDAASQWKASTSQLLTDQRFPLRLFSQGQIAAMAGARQQALLEVIDKAANTHTAKQVLEDARHAFFATRAKQRETGGKLKSRDALNLSLQDVQRKLERFEASHHAEILKSYRRTSRQTRELARQFEAATEMVERLRQVSASLLVEDLPDALFNPADDAGALSVMQKLAQAIAQAKAQTLAAAQLLAEEGSSLRVQLSQSGWQTQVGQSKLAYETLNATLLAQGFSDPNEHGRLEQERLRLHTEVKRLDALQVQFDGLKTQAKVQLETLRAARRKVSEVRRNFLQQSLAENCFVRMELIPYSHDAEAIGRSLRDLLRIDYSERFKDDIYVEAQGDSPSKGIIADLLEKETRAESPDELGKSQFESRIRKLQKRLGDACRGSGDFGVRFNKYLEAEAKKQPEFIDHIYCWFPEDGLNVEYSRNGDGLDFQSIGQASAGQRAAAMLAFLLAHGNEPLVLDQPEDDLDNHLIYDLVVQQIRANKQCRQLIIVTHNPNIVVNGDAEMIYALDFKSQCYISKSGSLQDKDMREEVCKVMEGGKVAFDRRYQRLGRRV